MRSSVRLEAMMPLTRLTLGEIAGLHEGQIIEIDATAQSAALLSARNKTLFVCEFGKLGQNYTVRVEASLRCRRRNSWMDCCPAEARANWRRNMSDSNLAAERTTSRRSSSTAPSRSCATCCTKKRTGAAVDAGGRRRRHATPASS